MLGVKAKTVSDIIIRYKNKELNFEIKQARPRPANKKIDYNMLKIIFESVMTAYNNKKPINISDLKNILENN